MAAPNRDNSKIILVQTVDQDGVDRPGGGGGGGDATEATLQDILVELETVVPYLPLPAVTASGDTTLTRGVVSISTATDTTLVAATASQFTRLHRAVLSVSGAVTLTFKSASTSLGAFDLPSAGVFSLDFSSYPWFKTAVNEALVLTTGSAVNVKGVVDYVKGT